MYNISGIHLCTHRASSLRIQLKELIFQWYCYQTLLISLHIHSSQLYGTWSGYCLYVIVFRCPDLLSRLCIIHCHIVPERRFLSICFHFSCKFTLHHCHTMLSHTCHHIRIRIRKSGNALICKRHTYNASFVIFSHRLASTHHNFISIFIKHHRCRIKPLLTFILYLMCTCFLFQIINPQNLSICNCKIRTWYRIIKIRSLNLFFLTFNLTYNFLLFPIQKQDFFLRHCNRPAVWYRCNILKCTAIIPF